MQRATRKKIATRIAMVLMVVAAFVCGRAYGWSEADNFMGAEAASLGVVVGPPPDRSFFNPSHVKPHPAPKPRNGTATRP